MSTIYSSSITKPVIRDWIASLVLLENPVFSNRCLIWVFTVFCEMCNFFAISSFPTPVVRSLRTSISLGVNSIELDKPSLTSGV